MSAEGAPQADSHWDAGSLNCGPLVLALRLRLKAMPGRILAVTAFDISAAEEIGAWCRITGNELIQHDPAENRFWIRSRSDWS